MSVSAATCLERLANENGRAKNWSTDQCTTYFACPRCGHARTSLECLWCDREALNQLLRERTGMGQGEIDTAVDELQEKP